CALPIFFRHALKAGSKRRTSRTSFQKQIGLEMKGNSASIGAEPLGSKITSRTWYRILWVVEIIAIVIATFVVTVPIQDYALREFKEWLSRPSPEALSAFRNKQQEESRLRMTIAAPFVTLAILLALPLYRLRPKSKS